MVATFAGVGSFWKHANTAGPLKHYLSIFRCNERVAEAYMSPTRAW